MANLTISIDDEVLKRARLRALREGTSVDALLRDYLERFTAVHAARRVAAERILGVSARAVSRRGGAAVLLSEDLQHGQDIEGVRVENPFLG